MSEYGDLCSRCENFYESPPDHNSCSGKMRDDNGDEITCPCNCNKPLSKQEIFTIRKMLNALT